MRVMLAAMTILLRPAPAVPVRSTTFNAPVLAVVGWTAVVLAIRLSIPLNHDVAWIMEGAQRLLAGGQFGRDVVDANPPLAWWISCIPAAVANVSGLGLGVSSVLFTTAAGLLSVWLTNAVLTRSDVASSTRAILISLLPVPLLISPGYDFGQREHLMLIGAIPYAAAASLAAQGRKLDFRLALAVGLFAAPAFCLKPYFLVVPVFVEAWLALRCRSLRIWLRPEFLVTPVFGVLYLAAIKLFAPDYLAVVMPEAAAIYWAFNAPVTRVVPLVAQFMAPPLLGWVLALVAKRSKPSLLAEALGVSAIAGAVSAVLQMKGFSYHLVPGIGLAWVACLAEAAGLLRTRKAISVAILSLLVAWAANVSFRELRDGTISRVEALASVFRTYAGPGGTVYAFVTSPRDIHPAIVASNTKWASVACCLYHLPAAVRADERPRGDRARILSVADSQTNRALEDLFRARPAVIVIDANAAKLGIDRPFAYLPYLSRFPGFAAFWRNYEEGKTVGGFRTFVRTGTP
ncbi:MAG TPA: hypothetical protein VMS78_01510 [Rhizomicrobium sp.]|nr:hypothetical protein [Rhizomicrobium sp.]